jgi:transmembrane sensor
MNDIFHISKLIIKKKLKVLTDAEALRLKQFNKEYPFSKNIDFERITQKISDYAAINKEQAWEAILDKSKKEVEIPVIPMNRPWYKYAAVASIVLLFSISYLFINKGAPIKSPVIVATPIEIGSNKAVLTLEDGSKVTLEKGKNYKSKNTNSNGEQIAYNNNTELSKRAFNFLTILRGGQFFVQLADGTKVWLNSESQLKYPIAFTDGETRKVELIYGEAYFEVSPSTAHKGSKFEVLTKKQTVEVLGTQFNIKAYKDEVNIYTTLVEGKVAISIANNKQILKPNQQSNIDLTKNNISIANVDVYSFISWKDGLFSFKSMPLKEIMKVLSRWYDVDVVFANTNLENVKFNGVLSKNQDLKEILTTIQTTKFINAYEIKNKTIIIK